MQPTPQPTPRSVARLALLFAAALALSACEEQLPPLDAETLFQSAETQVREHYYFAGEDFSVQPLYEAAIYAVTKGADAGMQPSRATLLAVLDSAPPEERRERIYAAMRAFLDALPEGYNTFVRPESLKWQNDPERTAGVGLVLHLEAPGRVLVVDSLEGSASYRQSMQVGRYVTKVDGVAVDGMDIEEVAGRIRGPADTRVLIEYDNGTSFELERGKVSFRNILNATWELPGGEKAEYVMLRSTLGDTAEQLRGLVSRMGERKYLILDLRRMYNGDYEKGFAAANLFVTSGDVGGLRFRTQEPLIAPADAERIFPGQVYVVLGERPSSFAVSFAASLQPASNVTLIGQNAQKGAFVSRVEELPGRALLSVTNGVVTGPDGTPLHESGVQVDRVVDAPLPEATPINIPNQNDPVQVFLAGKFGVSLE